MWLVIVPFCCGLSLTRYMKKEYQNLAMIMVAGYFLVLALFQVVYIPFVVFYNHFAPLVMVYGILMTVLSVASLIWNGPYWVKQYHPVQSIRHASWTTLGLWLVALTVVGFQLYKNIFYQFHDGDDALYAVTSVITWQNQNMYARVAYTGEASALDVRHAFSAAPIFISFLAKISGIHPTIVTHVIFSTVVLILFYLLIKLVADVLVDKTYVPLFLIFVSIMNIFGNNTIYLNSTFLLTRTAQGKAFLGNHIPVACILGLLLLWKQLISDKKMSSPMLADDNDAAGKNPGDEGIGSATNPAERVCIWVFLSCVMITAVYTSLMGLLLAALLIGGVTFFYTIYFRKIRVLLSCVIAMLPLVLMGGLYVKLFIF